MNLNLIPENLLLEFYKDLAQPGVQQIGQAIGDILSVTSFAALPFKLMNHKKELWFVHNLEKYRIKMSKTDPSTVHNALPEIAVPILEKMAYTTCEELSEMFANLLKNASTEAGVDKAHPNFVNIISSISRDEAILLEDMHKTMASIPFLFVTRKYSEGHWNTPITCFTKYHNDGRLTYPNNDEFYFDNLEKLGLVYQSEAKLNESYAQLESEIKPEIDKINENKGEKYTYYYRHIGISSVGKMFIKAVFE